MNDLTDPNAQPLLLALPESPELSEFWQQFFTATWDAWELIAARRRARVAATSTINQINEQGATQKAR